MLFVGEKRSNKAIKMGVTWKDGKLAAKQLFDALKYCNIEPKNQSFCNWFEYGGKTKVKNYTGLVVAMGDKVSNALSKNGIDHIKIVHPAARGKIRAKLMYCKHVKQKLIRET